LFFERPESRDSLASADSRERAVLVHVDFNRDQDPDDPREFEDLVLSARAEPAEFLTAQRSAPHPKYFIGTGKLEELRQAVAEAGARVAIFNHVLSPSQERNVERAIRCRVLDRVGLILDIFAQRARTHEGKLQVELAQLRHIATRLVRGWTHLERQKGVIRDRIRAIEGRLEKVRRQRQQGRRARRRATVPTVSLVGYTNAGKSTLFNRMTDAGVFAEDQLFATLDPTMRRLILPDVGPVVLADTVGFISHLPHRLVEAFRATLEEVASADLLLHVIDAAAEDPAHNTAQVNDVLAEIDADEQLQLKVFNKIDLLPDMAPRLERDADGRPVAVWLSAQAGIGLDLLRQAITELLATDMVAQTLHLPAQHARLRAKLYAQDAIVSENFFDDGSSDLDLRLPKVDLLRLLSAENLCWDDLQWRETDDVDGRRLAM